MSIYRLNVTIIKYFLDLQSQSKNTKCDCFRKGVKTSGKCQSVVPKRREVDTLGKNARVVELVDTLDSKSNEGNLVWVRVPPLVQSLLSF